MHSNFTDFLPHARVKFLDSSALTVLERALPSRFLQANSNQTSVVTMCAFSSSDAGISLISYLQDPPDWQEILKYFRGSELQNYFTKVLEDNLKALIKPQYVDHIPRAIKGNMTVDAMLDSKLELDNKQKLCDELELNEVLTRDVSQLSGGELQRFAIAMTCIQRADVYVLTNFCPLGSRN